MFACQQTGATLRWTVILNGTYNFSNSAISSLDGGVSNFTGDPGFGFSIHILPSISTCISIINSELRVTAVRQLNGVTVECLGLSGKFMSTIQIVSVSEFAHIASFN